MVSSATPIVAAPSNSTPFCAYSPKVRISDKVNKKSIMNTENQKEVIKRTKINTKKACREKKKYNKIHNKLPLCRHV
jgi:hypothetical protein